MTRDEHRHLNRETPARWLGYASAGGVALASAGAYGDIVLIDPTTTERSSSGLTIDLNKDGQNDFMMFVTTSTSNGSNTQSAVIQAVIQEVKISARNKSTTVDGPPWRAIVARSIMWTTVTTIGDNEPGSFGGIENGGSQYFGVKLSGNQYGWIHLELTKGSDNLFQSLSILNGAYDNTGAAIQVGAVPEPSSFAYLGLLAAGSGGVFALKKFRKHQLIEEAKA